MSVAHLAAKNFSVIEREKNHPEKDAYFCSRSCANSIGGKAKAVKHHQDDDFTSKNNSFYLSSNKKNLKPHLDSLYTTRASK